MIVNRIFPEEVGAYFARWRAVQEDISSSCSRHGVRDRRPAFRLCHVPGRGARGDLRWRATILLHPARLRTRRVPSQAGAARRAAKTPCDASRTGLDRASGAAERLIAEAAAESAARAANAFRRPPPAGWQAPPGEKRAGRGADLDLLVQVLESLRELIPPDLQQRLADAVRELLAIRALINWYLERLDAHREEPAEAQDIPITWE